MNSNRLKSLFLAAVLFGSGVAGNAMAAEQGPITLTSKVQEEITVINDKGEEVKQLIDTASVTPGDTVVYTTLYQNTGGEAVDNIVITNPVPDNMQYLQDTAFGSGTEITFSVDGGNNYATPDELTVTGEDGKPRRARAAEYTHIRWVFKPKLQPGKQGYVSFKARLN